MSNLLSALREFRKKGAFLRGLLGDFEGNIAVTGRPGYYYVRIEKPGGYEVGLFPGRVRPLYNLPVRVETHPVTKVQFIAGLDDETVVYGGGNPGEVPALDRHQESHGWGGDDQLQWLHTLQIFPVRCQPDTADPDSVVIQGGVYLSQGQLSWLTSPLNVDLSAYRVPQSRYVILSLTPLHEVIVTATVAKRVEEISVLPGGAFLVAAVCLRGDAPVAQNDIVDLRFLNSGVVNGGVEIGADYIIVGDPASGRWVKIGYLDDALFGLNGRVTGTLTVDSTDFTGLVLERSANDVANAIILWGDNDEQGNREHLWFVFRWRGNPDNEEPTPPETRYLTRVAPDGTWTYYGRNDGGLPLLIKNAGDYAGAMAENTAQEHGAWYMDNAGHLWLHNYETGKDVALGGPDGWVIVRGGNLVMGATATVDGVDVSAHAAATNAHGTALDDLTDVDAATPDDGDALIWDAEAELWVPGYSPGTGPLGLDDLTDVIAPTPSDGDMLVWTDAHHAWVTKAPDEDVIVLRDSYSSTYVTSIEVADGDLIDLGGGNAHIKTASEAEFTRLIDGPGTYEGQAGKTVVVNATADGLEFVEFPSGGAVALDDLTDVDAATPDDGDALVWDDTSKAWSSRLLTGGEVIVRDVSRTVQVYATYIEVADGDLIDNRGGEAHIKTASEAEFTRLIDGPGTYDGQAGKTVVVNATADGLEFVEFPSGGAVALDDLTDVDAATPDDGDGIFWNSGTATWVATSPPAGGGAANSGGLLYLFRNFK